MMKKPIIAITMGDASGIGPEIIVKVLSQKGVWESCNPFIVAEPRVMTDIRRVVGANLRFRTIQSVNEASFSPPEVDVLCPEGVHIDHVPWGQVDSVMAGAAVSCLQKAFELAQAGEVQGVVSAPINKEAFHRAGYHYPDELAYLTEFTNSLESFILGVMGFIWTVAITEHIPFKEVADSIQKDKILWYVDKIHQVLQKVGHTEPRIAVAALNPHAGEGGLFGREEIDQIEPAIRAARLQGIKIEGPVPADMVFVRALAEDFDGVVCMYHDQANIARKLQPMEQGATLYMGLPVVCGTTAHGTALDIAGQGIADPGSLEAAIKYTVLLTDIL